MQRTEDAEWNSHDLRDGLWRDGALRLARRQGSF